MLTRTLLSFMAGAPDNTWNPAGWSHADEIEWDKLGHFAFVTIQAVRDAVAGAGFLTLVGACFGLAVAIAIGRFVSSKL